MMSPLRTALLVFSLAGVIPAAADGSTDPVNIAPSPDVPVPAELAPVPVEPAPAPAAPAPAPAAPAPPAQDAGTPSDKVGVPVEKVAVIPASEIKQALTQDGRIAIYGIYFEFDKAEILPESQPQIAQLAALLKAKPDLSILVVGHTDAQGDFEYNMTLSQQRAQAIADALVSGFEIGASRITPAGAGMVAPVATNRTEEGRAQNRRVEIVEISGG